MSGSQLVRDQVGRMLSGGSALSEIEEFIERQPLGEERKAALWLWLWLWLWAPPPIRAPRHGHHPRPEHPSPRHPRCPKDKSSRDT
jgi:hypothetical protein